ncbi:MAG: type II toxin-antitoxin system RelE/ParE family toxin [Opitutaceae bacterium]|nr:type II toxin-antitoxin system RelE/ParE family toxin [Opitutaceae bacterium]
MNGYTVNLSANAADWLESCRDAKLKRRIAAAIDGLGNNPRPSGCVKLAGEDAVWRVRVGEYRILYEVHDGRLVVLVIRIAKRSEASRPRVTQALFVAIGFTRRREAAK